MNTLRQYLFLFSIILFCTSTPHVWAQQPRENTPKAVQYTYKVIAKKVANQTTVIDGLTIRSFDGSHFSGKAFLADNGDFIYYAYTNKGYALFKNQHVLAYEGKSISGITDGKSEGDELNFRIYAVSPLGDVLYDIQYTKPNDNYPYYHAMALNDAVVWDQSAQDQASKTNHTPRLVSVGKPGFTKDSKVAIPLAVEGSSKREWLIGGAIQDTPPDGADGDFAPITDETNVVRLSKHTGIKVSRFAQQEVGIKNYYDDEDFGAVIFTMAGCSARQNAKGQIAIIWGSGEDDLSASGKSTATQVVVLATPTNAPGPEPPCPHYQEMLASAKELDQLANTWETDDEAYHSAVIDMIFTGYSSPYAAPALDIPSEDIPLFFKDDLAIRANRSILIAHLRTKAANRKRFAEMGIAQKYGQGVYAKENIELFCSLDSSKFTKEFWDALWMAGYIDYDCYTQVENQLIVYRYKNYFDTLATLASLPIAEVTSISQFVFRAGLKKLFLTRLEVSAVKELAVKTLPRSLGELPGPTVKTVIAQCFRGGVYRNRLVQAEEILYRYHGTFNRNATRKVVWLTNKRYTSEAALRKEMAIRADWGVEIDSVSVIQVPKGTWLSEGEAAAQGAGYPGGGYQAAIENVPDAWVLRTDKAW